MTGFRGLHSDAAMPPPDADLASREEGDPLPCPQDKEFLGLPVPVPVQKDARSMTQAEALHGGFLLDLDDDEKERFTPSKLLLYKHAVEYRYISVHTSTYRYILVHTSMY